jgi:hypothetical protein
MEDRLEIIVTEDKVEPRVVRFEELFSMRDRITSIMFLWNANSYYVNALTNTFMVNGGRKIKVENLGECSILYRRRNSLVTSTTGGEQRRMLAWMIGLQSKEDKKMLALKIDDDGATWQWVDAL